MPPGTACFKYDGKIIISPSSTSGVKVKLGLDNFLFNVEAYVMDLRPLAGSSKIGTLCSSLNLKK
jgi:hypothetical protein